MKIIRIPVALIIAFALSGCETMGKIALVEAIEQATNSDISAGSYCQQVRATCELGHYREWQTPSGGKRCACENQNYR